MLIDSHCHLDKLDLSPYNGDVNNVIDAAAQVGVKQILSISVNLEDIDVIKGFTKRQGIYASVGVHPLHTQGLLTSQEKLIELAQHEKIIALGETGLDYFYEKDSAIHDAQKNSFIQHLKAASRLELPVIIHTRDAKSDTMALIREYSNPRHAGVLHCFTEDYEMAKAAVDENYLISISGIVTFKTAQELKETVRKLPLESLLVETDSPYLAPVPHRGKKNEPQYVTNVAQYVADLKGIRYESVLEATAANFHRLFSKAVPEQTIQLLG